MPAPKERTTINVQAERTVLAAVRLPESRFDKLDPFGELRALAEQAGAIVVGELSQAMERPVAGTYMGSGKVQELKALCEALDATSIIFDHGLSPKQIANIEEATGRKVLDRSELILDIFASRATSHEAKLQVELAQLEYTYPRLKAMWDHLERIVGRGGIGGIGTRGPGEQQLEIDRRLAQDKRLRLERQLQEIQTRKQREVRERKLDHYTVGLVGYTNAGKSTLFNTLTAGGAYADDRVFATLISRTRTWDLKGNAPPKTGSDAAAPLAQRRGGGLSVMLSDTVGFVRDLPTNLIASFRATLEEATHADLLLIVLDVADPAAALHYDTVNQTLEDLFKETAAREARDGHTWTPPLRLVLLNKVDKLPDNRETLIWQQRVPDALSISARDLSHPGHTTLRDRVRVLAQGQIEELRITVPLSDAKTIHTIENRAEVLDRRYNGTEVTLHARIGRRQLDQLRSMGARMRVDRGTALGGVLPDHVLPRE